MGLFAITTIEEGAVLVVERNEIIYKAIGS